MTGILMRDGESTAGGFTLVETLVAMAFLAMLSAFGVQSIQRLSEIKRVESVISRSEGIQSARQHLLEVISGIRPTMTSNINGETKLYFKGTHSSLIFTNVLDDRLVRGNISRVVYELADTELFFKVLNSEDGQSSNSSSTKLLENLNLFKFSYFGKAGDQVIAAWHESWDENYLPKAVRIDAAFDVDGQKMWEPLIIGLALAK